MPDPPGQWVGLHAITAVRPLGIEDRRPVACFQAFDGIIISGSAQ
jgi:hypothetical protein